MVTSTNQVRSADAVRVEPVSRSEASVGILLSIWAVALYGDGMTDTDPAVTPDRDKVDERAHLLPEELAAGSVDPHEQAEVILEESAERTEDPEGTREESTQVP